MSNDMLKIYFPCHIYMTLYNVIIHIIYSIFNIVICTMYIVDCSICTYYKMYIHDTTKTYTIIMYIVVCTFYNSITVYVLCIM